MSSRRGQSIGSWRGGGNTRDADEGNRERACTGGGGTLGHFGGWVGSAPLPWEPWRPSVGRHDCMPCIDGMAADVGTELFKSS